MAKGKLRSAVGVETGILRQAPFIKPRVAPKRTVLVIEPNLMALELYRMVLRPLRCAVVHAESGERALQTARRYQPDLIVMELYLPGLSGLETLDALESLPELAAVPIIAVSTLPCTGILPPSAIAELADHFEKPIDAPRLLAAVSRFLV
jgi:CheY-like chemotaxis protein